MAVMIQASTGTFARGSAVPDVTARLVAYASRVGAAAAIIGWDPGAPYGRIVAGLHEAGVAAYVWLPVFAEYGAAAHPALDLWGRAHRAAVSDADDDFTFACPSDPANIDLAVATYDRSFAGAGWDGVFLDKIRYSSFANGFAAGLGCYCLECCAFYAARGAKVDAFRGLVDPGDQAVALRQAQDPQAAPRCSSTPHQAVEQGGHRPPVSKPLVPVAREGATYRFADPVVDGMYRARADRITTAVAQVVGALRARGLAIGLDLFAPVLAYLVGQDTAALAGLADFVKPMIYRVTDAPAGIPYEVRHLKTELAAAGYTVGDRLESLWGTTDLAGDDCLREQFAVLRGLGTPVYTGVEVNRLGFCPTSPQYVRSTLAAAQSAGLAGAVLSWNVLADTVYP